MESDDLLYLYKGVSKVSIIVTKEKFEETVMAILVRIAKEKNAQTNSKKEVCVT